MKKSDEERFWEKVKGGTPDSCWLWQGHIRPAGYGMFRMGGAAQQAHRVAYYFANPWQPGHRKPENTQINHTCGNKACVNPNHLTASPRKGKQGGRVRPKMPPPPLAGTIPGEPANPLALEEPPKQTVTAQEVQDMLCGGMSPEDILERCEISPELIQAVLQGGVLAMPEGTGLLTELAQLMKEAGDKGL